VSSPAPTIKNWRRPFADEDPGEFGICDGVAEGAAGGGSAEDGAAGGHRQSSGETGSREGVRTTGATAAGHGDGSDGVYRQAVLPDSMVRKTLTCQRKN
jgi:hypothetical protein